jgi:hypothetical protein
MTHTLRYKSCLYLFSSVILCVNIASAVALPLPVNDVDRKCWLSYSRERTQVNLREPTSVDFSNLKEGYSVTSPFLVEFAVRGMGVVPAGKQLKGTGHHHILIDTRLPLNVTEKIPFSNTHKHFGKGQTFAVLELPPGRHNLRLLFADHDHRPYFVFSPEVSVQVLGPRATTAKPKIDAANFSRTCAAWYQEEVSRPRLATEPLHIANIRDGETLASPFNVRMGVQGYGVCAQGQTAERSGYFIMNVLNRADRKTVQVFNLSSGATQVSVSIKPGAYILKLRFVDPKQGRDLLLPHELNVSVAGK